MTTIDVKVRFSNGAYIARCDGKTASCTYSPTVAVTSVCKKIFGDKQRLIMTELTPVGHMKLGITRVSPDPSQVCHVCGCNFYHACNGGCHWVEENLCSNCGGRDQ